ncbi:hypothetical protein [Devosia sp.]|uniref:DUF1254 domain-containing protein n=1 Tax=Devosia sp. TaxID=1871048 RepID=UPI0035B10ABD
MIRTLLWAVAGVVLGGIIHIAVILALPALSPTVAWDQVAALGEGNGPYVLPAARPDQPNSLRLDPELAYAVCRLDLRNGPGTVAGTLPQAFWSVAVYNRMGTVVYSTTNRDGVGTTLDIGLFNAAQTRLLAQQQLDIAEGLLVVESQTDELMVLVRLAPPHPAMRVRYEKALAGLRCSNLDG